MEMLGGPGSDEEGELEEVLGDESGDTLMPLSGHVIRQVRVVRKSKRLGC